MTTAKLKNVRKQFGLRIRELRQQRGWSQEEFADECGVHRTYIGGVERGERNVSLDNIARIAIALDMEISALFQQPGK